MNPILLLLLFVGASVLGYFIISKVPSLLHTPLMSGMNALSGITILGAISVLIAIAGLSKLLNFFLIDVSILGLLKGIAFIALILASINVVGGFTVTEKMLAYFKKKKGGQK